jgi:hypothetical protein
LIRLPQRRRPRRGGDRHAPANTSGIRHVAFAVGDIDAVVADLRGRGTELVGEVERYDDSHGLLRPRPGGIIVELAEQTAEGSSEGSAQVVVGRHGL